jgi:hypothetical protein
LKSLWSTPSGSDRAACTDGLPAVDMARSEAAVICNWMTSGTVSAAKSMRLAYSRMTCFAGSVGGGSVPEVPAGRGSAGDIDDHVPVVLLAGSRNPERALVDDANREGGLSLE